MQTAGAGEGAGDSPDVPPADVEMRDAAALIQVDAPVAGAGTVVDAVSGCTDADGTMVVSMAGDGVPVPPTAPTNGNLCSIVGAKHKKSVSFVVEGAEVDSILAGVGGAGDKLVPPLPPVALHTIGGRDLDKSTAAGANEAFLRRNFFVAGGPEEVRTLGDLFFRTISTTTCPTCLYYSGLKDKQLAARVDENPL